LEGDALRCPYGLLGEDLIVGLAQVVYEEGGREPFFFLIFVLVLVPVSDLLWGSILVLFVWDW